MLTISSAKTYPFLLLLLLFVSLQQAKQGRRARIKLHNITAKQIITWKGVFFLLPMFIDMPDILRSSRETWCGISRDQQK